MKKRSIKASSPTSKSLDFKDMFELSCGELKRMRQLSSIDDAFHLSWDTINEIICMFRSSTKPPTLKQFMEWDVYARAFYLKMHSSCWNNPPLFYRHLKHTECAQPLTEEILSEEFKLMECAQPLTEEISSEKVKLMECDQYLTEEISSEEILSEENLLDEDDEEDVFCCPVLRGPFEFGFYSEGTSPDRIPYHLYLLVKEAVDIMTPSMWRNNTYEVTKLTRVEEKIRFFCNYFHSHLPNGWKYKRINARKEVASYDTTRQPRYNMAGYTPVSSFAGRLVEFEYDEKSNLSRQEMVAIMWIIHSRKTPVIWEMCPQQISFYCKMCSCFGIDYHRLEAASEDDVCLMNVGLHPSYKY